MPALLSNTLRPVLSTLLLLACFVGCAAIPDVSHKPQFHNPFPQLHKVAVLPFFNQSREPTVDGDGIALAYYNELQAIPGFEVMPVGTAKQYLAALQADPQTGEEFQSLARRMGVDVIIVGSVTEYTPYYPPRIGLSVDWYAANPGFHPIPAGYGLPWDSPEEEYIPERIVQQAEFELAREQLATQTPELPPAQPEVGLTAGESPEVLPEVPSIAAEMAKEAKPVLPPTWPDPRGFVPAAPSPVAPPLLPQPRPVITHTRLYDGKDADFTGQLERYFYHQDDARFVGWRGYLQRPDDFIRFCCHLHVTETLAARGGAGKSRVIVRWPIGRYER